jgi:phosphoribosylamine--glycine ligase
VDANAGSMIIHAGPKVLKFNVRFGDPETYHLAMLMKSDIVTVMRACMAGP